MSKKLVDIPLNVVPRINRMTSVSDAARLLLHESHSVVIVCDCGPDDLVGWVSRDTVLRNADQLGHVAGSVPLARIMARTVDVCYIDYTLESAMSLVVDRCSRFVAVFDQHEHFRGVAYRHDLQSHIAGESRHLSPYRTECLGAPIKYHHERSE